MHKMRYSILHIQSIPDYTRLIHWLYNSVQKTFKYHRTKCILIHICILSARPTRTQKEESESRSRAKRTEMRVSSQKTGGLEVHKRRCDADEEAGEEEEYGRRE
jgi:hypothetical protein